LNDAYDYDDRMLFHFPTAPQGIADAGTSQFDIQVGEDRIIRDVDVALWLEHAWTPDLDIYLVHNGTRVELSTDNGFFDDLDPACPCVRKDFGIEDAWVRFDDESAVASITDTQSFSEVVPFFLPFAGTYSPEQALSAFNGHSTTGTWTLEVSDDESADVGTLLGFSLVFSIETLSGDYNGDGTVNAADYTVWRNSLGDIGPNLAADGDGDGEVTPLDFNVWKMHYGESFAGGAALDSLNSAGKVPEPMALCHLGILVIGWAFVRRRLGAVQPTAQ
jgi:subtilisin-like proprotein convertase family protein